ncbi:sugar transporter SWEET1-like [Homalodisca vitripennis]|uniref:sugar transporter SWEET1-like n=1 Tax=Homalodisca vitripennis TaxID=197043 RepID=UPI001EEA064F|nr:sugar transporter SWEET1-like [Homalodisca vitripennis]
MPLDLIEVPSTVNASHDGEMMDYKHIIATTASISTILQFLSGILVCRKFMKKGTTNEVSSFHFVAGFLSCGLWLNYGIMINDSSLILVNAVGAILFMCYILLFFSYTLRKTTVVKQVLWVVTVMVLVRMYGAWLGEVAQAKVHLGYIACCTSLMFFGAPLANLAYVLRVKSAESLPFPMIVMTFIVSLQWLLYGIILENPIIQYPNIIGCVLSLLQLSLFVVFPGR